MAASASATISLCSSFATHCKISQNLQTLATHFSFPSLSSSSSSHKLSSCSLRRPTFPLLIKSSESDSAVVIEADFQAPEPEAGPDDAEPAALQVVETPSSEAPKREQLFGVVMIGACQYIVIPGRFIYTQRLKGANVNDKVEIDVDSFVGSFRPDIMETVYAWAEGSKFYEIMSATLVFEGSLIRAIRRLEEVLQQLIQAAKSVGETELESKFEEAVSKIKRDIVFAASLYL